MSYCESYNSPETKLVSVRIRMNLFNKIDRLADESGMTRSAVVNTLLTKSLGAEKADRLESLEMEVMRLRDDLDALREEVKSLTRGVHAIDIDEF